MSWTVLIHLKYKESNWKVQRTQQLVKAAVCVVVEMLSRFTEVFTMICLSFSPLHHLLLMLLNDHRPPHMVILLWLVIVFMIRVRGETWSISECDATRCGGLGCVLSVQHAVHQLCTHRLASASVSHNIKSIERQREETKKLIKWIAADGQTHNFHASSDLSVYRKNMMFQKIPHQIKTMRSVGGD